MASHYAAKHGQDNLRAAMEKALANLTADYRPGDDQGAPRPEQQAVLLACEITRITLAADRHTVN